MSALEEELAELRAVYEEFKESSAAIEEDLEQEVAKLEKENARSAHKLQLAEQAMENATRKAEQARELANRQVLTLEKQIQAMEVSLKAMTEDRRRMEQEKDDVERLHRQLQAQTEDQAESFEELVEREAMLRVGMEDLELKFHRTTLEHMTLMTKLKAAFKMLYAQLKRLKQTPIAQMPDATPEEQASMEAEIGLQLPDRSSIQNEEAVQAELNAKLQEQLASALAQLDQSQRRVKELEFEVQRERKLTQQPDDSPRSAVGAGTSMDTSGEEKPIKSISEGYLYKRGDGALSTWKRQLYKINNENHSLEFFFLQVSKVTTKRIKLGDIPLSGAQIAFAQKDDKPNVFCIQPRFSKKTFYLQAPNSAEREAWVNSLQLETDAAAMSIAGSVRQDWVEISYDQISFEPMYCVVSKNELQLFRAEDDDKPSKRFELDETVEIQRLPKMASQRPALSLKFGAAVSVEHVYLGFNSAEKRDTWQELVSKISNNENVREDSLDQSNPNDDQEGAEFPFCGLLNLFDPNAKRWDPFWFQLSEDTNFLDYFPDQKSASSDEQRLGRLALLGSVQNVTSTAIVSNFPAGAYIEHEHIFGLTPPFTSMTRLLQCSSEENLFQWMDGLVTLLDSKVARDPYSTKEGYLYKQGVKATSKWRKKYIVLGLPDLKYYKAGRHTRAVILTLTPESQIILRHPVKKFVYTFTLQESPGSREFLWGSKSQAEGEAWVSTLQACITKLRLRQPNPTTFNIPKLRGSRTRDPSKDPTSRATREISPNVRVRDVSPSPAIHTRKSSGDWGIIGSGGSNTQPKLVPRRVMRKNTNPDSIDPRISASSNVDLQDEADMFRQQSQKSAAYAFSIAQTRRLTGPPSATSSPITPNATISALAAANALANSPSSPASALSAPLPLSPSDSNSSNAATQTEVTTHLSITTPTSSTHSVIPPASTSTFNFVPRESANFSSFPPVSSASSSSVQPLSTARRAVLHVLKTSLFSRNERWAPMVFELQANDRVLNYYEQGSTKPVQCSVAGCTDEPFTRFDGLCAHHHRIKGRMGEDSPSHQKKKSFTWNLVGAQIEAHVTNQYPGHEFTFGLTGTGGPALVVATHDEKERAEWLSLLRARIYARFMFQSSSYEGLMGQLGASGEWKEKYYVVRLGCLECYNRTDHKRAWSHKMTGITKVRAEDLAVATGKVGSVAGLARSMSNVGRNGTLRSSASFLKGPSNKNTGHLVDFLAASNVQASEGRVVCENNSDRCIHPKGVFVVDFGSEKLVLGAESPAERDLWIAALDACVKEAKADAEDDDILNSEDDESKHSQQRRISGSPRRTQSLGGRENSTRVQISVSQNTPPTTPTPAPVAGGSEDVPSHMSWWANNRAGKIGTPPTTVNTLASLSPLSPSAPPGFSGSPARASIPQPSSSAFSLPVLAASKMPSVVKTPPPPPVTSSKSVSTSLPMS